MTKISGPYRVIKTTSDANLNSVKSGAIALDDTIRAAITSLEAQGIRDWQILSAWSALLHERGDFQKGEVLSMATQMIVELEGKAEDYE